MNAMFQIDRNLQLARNPMDGYDIFLLPSSLFDPTSNFL